MDFDNEFLDALAHLDSAPAAPSTIKTFKSVTTSVTSPLPAEDPSAMRVNLMKRILMAVMGIVM